MRRGKHAAVLFAGALLLLAGCGEDTVAPPDGGNGGNGGGGGGPLEVFDIFLRPYVIARGSSLAGGLPNPQESLYYLTAFYSGGEPVASFSWQFDPRLGSILPKTVELTPTSATVSVLNDGLTPLGFYDISVEGTSGGLHSSYHKRFAVVEINWMKHDRAIITNPSDPPVDLELDPVFVSTGASDQIYFVGSPSKQAVSLWSIFANASLEQPPATPEMSLFVVPNCNSNPCPWGTVDGLQALSAEEREPDPSPAGMGRDELLFSSQMDPQFLERLEVTNDEKIGFNLWVVKRPTSLGIPFRARVLTSDVKFDSLGSQWFRVYQHRQPRWDPTAVAPAGQPARIAFTANRGPDPLVAYGTNLWLGDLHDLDSDGVSDSLMNLRQLTNEGGITSFDWTPDGQFIYFLAAGKDEIFKLPVANPQAVESISLAALDSELGDLRFISVCRADGNLLAFQGSSENRVYLFVYDVAAASLIRATPYEFPPGRNLFPRWHPTRREIVFVGDYTVARWLDNGDVYPLGNPVYAGVKRTLYPSVWSVQLEER